MIVAEGLFFLCLFFLCISHIHLQAVGGDSHWFFISRVWPMPFNSLACRKYNPNRRGTLGFRLEFSPEPKLFKTFRAVCEKDPILRGNMDEISVLIQCWLPTCYDLYDGDKSGIFASCTTPGDTQLPSICTPRSFQTPDLLSLSLISTLSSVSQLFQPIRLVDGREAEGLACGGSSPAC